MKITSSCILISHKLKTDISLIIHRSFNLMIGTYAWLEVLSQRNLISGQESCQYKAVMMTNLTLTDCRKSIQWWFLTLSKHKISKKDIKIHITRLFLKWKCKNMGTMPLVVYCGKSISTLLVESLKENGAPMVIGLT